MEKRKSRDKVDKDKVDFSKPIVDIGIFGSADDPCFGALFSLDAKECNRCGDNEICAIVTAQRMKGKREKVESKAAFKDLEEVDIFIHNKLKNLVITNKVTRLKDITEKIQKEFQFKTPEEAKSAIKRVISNSKKLKAKKKDGKWFILEASPSK